MADPIPAPVKRIAQIINHQIHPSEPAVASAAVNNAKRIHAEMVAPAVTRAELAETHAQAAEEHIQVLARQLAEAQARIRELENSHLELKPIPAGAQAILDAQKR